MNSAISVAWRLIKWLRLSGASDSASDRQAPDTKARFFNDNNCSVLQCQQGFLQNDAQSVDYVRSASVL
jgi:hypothetical protein